MILPISDDDSDRTITPVVNYLLIAINIFVFIFLQGFGTDDKFTYAYATVPYEIVTGQDVKGPVPIKDVMGNTVGRINLQPTPISVYITLLTSMFIHGGWAHILGNMLFLWIFGDNIEEALGHGRYLIFYLVCGVIASLAHVFITVAFGGNPYVPSLGASGAISGVLGGYILLYPTRRVTVFILRILTDVPAYVAIGFWFLFQIVSSLGLLGGGPQVGGVAYAAHVGGFIAGLVLVKLFAVGRRPGMRPVA